MKDHNGSMVASTCMDSLMVQLHLNLSGIDLMSCMHGLPSGQGEEEGESDCDCEIYIVLVFIDWLMKIEIIPYESLPIKKWPVFNFKLVYLV